MQTRDDRPIKISLGTITVPRSFYYYLQSLGYEREAVCKIIRDLGVEEVKKIIKWVDTPDKPKKHVDRTTK